MPKKNDQTHIKRIPQFSKTKEDASKMVQSQILRKRKRRQEEADMRLGAYIKQKYRRLYLEAIERCVPDVLKEFNAILKKFPPFFPVVAAMLPTINGVPSSSSTLSEKNLYLPGNGFANLQDRVLYLRKANGKIPPNLEEKLYDWLVKWNLTDEWIFETVEASMQHLASSRLSEHLPSTTPVYSYGQRTDTSFESFVLTIMDKHYLTESYEEFEERVKKRFAASLASYKKAYFEWVEKQDNLKIEIRKDEEKFESFHFECLALYQCRKLSYEGIEKEYFNPLKTAIDTGLTDINPDKHKRFAETVRWAVNNTATFINVKLRESARGPKRKET
jgi:hypothetical protein